jgi:hypothetical protein
MPCLSPKEVKHIQEVIIAYILVVLPSRVNSTMQVELIAIAADQNKSTE